MSVPYALLTTAADLVGSAALAIVLATFAVRLLLLPLTVRAFRAERVRRRLAPRLTELRERHADDPLALARASSELLRAEGSGPLAGLLPMLAQMPFFFLLYRLCTSTTVDGAPNALLGQALLGTSLGDTFAADPLALAFWPLFALLAVVAWWTGRLLPAGTLPVLRLLPFGSLVAAGFVPLAAGLYLLATGLWTAVERTVVTRALQGGSPC